MTRTLDSYSDPLSRIRTKTMRALVESDARIVAFTIEHVGVFIYTNSDEWCDDHGSGTFRGDSETAAVQRYRERVQRAEPQAPTSHP